MRMICNMFILIFIFSFTDPACGGTESFLKGKKSWDGEKACGSYFLRELFRLFADEKIEQRIQGVYNKLKKELYKQREEDGIAFTAKLEKDETFSSRAVFKFTNVITNVGGGLNSTDGVFYCPEPGLYSFFVKVMAYTTSAFPQIYKNEAFVAFVHTGQGSSNFWRTGSAQVMLKLKRGDRVYVKSGGSKKYHHYGTQFSGYKI